MSQVRFTRTAIVAILAAAFLSFGAQGFAISGAAKPQHSTKEDVREAVKHLQEAQSLLSKADHDDKGPDYQALKHTEEAIASANEFLGVKD